MSHFDFSKDYNLLSDKTQNILNEGFDLLHKSTTEVIKEAVNVIAALRNDLYKSQSRLSAITSESNDSIVLETVNGVWLNANEHACKILDIDNTKCRGRTNQEVIALYPHLNDLITMIDALEKESLDKSTITKDFITFKKKDLSTVHMHLSAIPIKDSSKDSSFKEFIIIGTDITSDQKEQINPILADDVINAMPIAMIVLYGASLKIKLQNDFARGLFERDAKTMKELFINWDDEKIKGTREYLTFKLGEYTISSTPVINSDIVAYYIITVR